MRHLQAASATWIFKPGAIKKVLAELGFLPELIHFFERQAQSLAAWPSARAQFLEIADPWLEGTSPAAPTRYGNFHGLIAVAGLPQMMARHRARSLPAAITAATARDLQRRMVERREKTGEWEFNRLNWFSHHIHRNLLEIGRLQFLPAPSPLPYLIYTAGPNQEKVHAFPEAGLPGSPSGWIENPSSFSTILSEDTDGITGHPVDWATGQLQVRPVRHRKVGYQLRLARTTPVLDIHIPGGPGLSRDACEASLQEAARVFGKYFPEIAWKAFVCTSWLLDRELWKCLPAHSNIVAFAKMFLPLGVPDATSRQLFERVFEGVGNLATFQPRTRLQQAILHHLAKGGTFRETSGIILRHHLPGS